MLLKLILKKTKDEDLCSVMVNDNSEDKAAFSTLQMSSFQTKHMFARGIAAVSDC